MYSEAVEVSKKLDVYRTGKAYTIREAADYAGTTPATVRRWVRGYEASGHRMRPVFAEMDSPGEAPRLSFLELAEIVVAVRFTQHGGKLEKVRAARQRAQHMYADLPYPFASLRLKQLGGEILHVIDEEMGGKALALSLGGPEGDQYALPQFVDDALDLFDFDPLDSMATRWFPAGRDVPLVVDPHFGGGRLTIQGRGVTVQVIRDCFFRDDQDIEFIASDYELDVHVVQEVIRWDGKVTA